MVKASLKPKMVTATVESYKVPAAERAMDVLEALASCGGGMTIKRIAARLSLSISEIFRIIVVMERRGMIRKDPANDEYAVTFNFLELVLRATPAQNLVAMAIPVMFRLSQACAQSSYLTIPTNRRAVVVAEQPGLGLITFGVRLGTVLNPLESSAGNVLLAFSDADRRCVLLGGPPPPGLIARLDAIAAIGFDQRESRHAEGVHDISVPVFGFDRYVVASLTVPHLTLIDTFNQLNENKTRGLLLDAAREISAALGNSQYQNMSATD